MNDDPDTLARIRNEAAKKFATETEHIEINADTASAEIIIYNIRFMAYNSGWRDGFEAARKEKA